MPLELWQIKQEIMHTKVTLLLKLAFVLNTKKLLP